MNMAKFKKGFYNIKIIKTAFFKISFSNLSAGPKKVLLARKDWQNRKMTDFLSFIMFLLNLLL